MHVSPFAGQVDCSRPTAHQLQTLRVHGLWRPATCRTVLAVTRTRSSRVVLAAGAQDVSVEKPRVTVFGTGLMGECQLSISGIQNGLRCACLSLGKLMGKAWNKILEVGLKILLSSVPSSLPPHTKLPVHEKAIGYSWRTLARCLRLPLCNVHPQACVPDHWKCFRKIQSSLAILAMFPDVLRLHLH